MREVEVPESEVRYKVRLEFRDGRAETKEGVPPEELMDYADWIKKSIENWAYLTEDLESGDEDIVTRIEIEEIKWEKGV